MQRLQKLLDFFIRLTLGCTIPDSEWNKMCQPLGKRTAPIRPDRPAGSKQLAHWRRYDMMVIRRSRRQIVFSHVTNHILARHHVFGGGS